MQFFSGDSPNISVATQRFHCDRRAQPCLGTATSSSSHRDQRALSSGDRRSTVAFLSKWSSVWDVDVCMRIYIYIYICMQISYNLTLYELSGMLSGILSGTYSQNLFGFHSFIVFDIDSDVLPCLVRHSICMCSCPCVP